MVYTYFMNGLTVLEGLPPLPPLLLWAVFAAVAAGFATISWVLFYHWGRYGSGRKAVAAAKTVYTLVGAGLLASAFVSLLAY